MLPLVIITDPRLNWVASLILTFYKWVLTPIPVALSKDIRELSGVIYDISVAGILYYFLALVELLGEGYALVFIVMVVVAVLFVIFKLLFSVALGEVLAETALTLWVQGVSSST